MKFKKYRFTFKAALLAVSMCFVSKSSAQSKPSYFDSLKNEFKEVGRATFIAGETEAEGVKLISGGNEQVYNVEGEAFAYAKSITVEKKPNKFWDAKRMLFNKKPIKKGESLLVVFWAKGKKAPQFVDDGEGAIVQPYIHSKVGNYHKGRVTSFYIRKDLKEGKWQRFFVKTDPLEFDFKPGDLSLVFMMGQKAQTVDIGGVSWLSFAEGANVAKMPKRVWSYPGREKNAAWRKEADQRIDKYRKGDFKVQCLKADGTPAANQEIKITMKKHKFGFGVAVNVWAFNGQIGGMKTADVEKYKQISSKYFNSVTVENAMKWHLYDSSFRKDPKRIIDTLKFYNKKDMLVRGHTLVWPSIFRTPKHLQQKFKDDHAFMRKRILEHIKEEIELFRPYVTDWDVTNETAVNRAYMDLMGPEVMLEWYKYAKELAPDVKLTFNETSFGSRGLEIGSFPEDKLNDKMRGWADYMVQSDSPVTHFGDQAHSGKVSLDYKGKTGAEGLWAYWDYLTDRYNRKLQLTELDVKINNENDPDQVEYQKDVLRDSIIIAFAHPSMDSVTQWGFWEGRHYAPTAALWTKDWKMKPHAQEYIDLVYKTWWTDVTVTTDENGVADFRGFYGKYEIKSADQKVNVETRQLVKDNQAVKVIVD